MSNPFDELRGKVAIITGGAQGIGRACAQTLTGDGVTVVIADIAVAEGEATAQQIQEAGGSALFTATDVGEHSQIRDLVTQVVDKYGRLDFVVNNAYWSVRKGIVELAEEEWDKGMNVMLKAVYLFGKYAFPEMIKVGGGGIVNISSVHGLSAIRNYPVYAAAKAGLINLTRQMALDGGPHNIRVNAICPGWIKTQGSANFDEEQVNRITKLYPLGRGGEPIEIATAVRFLLSNQASFVTGHALVVDGGLTAQLQDNNVLSED